MFRTFPMSVCASLLLALQAPAADAATVKLGGKRPAELYMPWSNKTARPLVLFLHGYTAPGSFMQAFLGIRKAADELDFISVIPSGSRDIVGSPFWNATPECCNFYGSERDDVTYLSELIEEAKTKVSIGEVYIVGHSNGGFMAHRMACERPDLIEGIASISGGFYRDPQLCKNPGSVNILEIHGTWDPTVPYWPSISFAGTKQNLQDWAEIYNCTEKQELIGADNLIKWNWEFAGNPLKGMGPEPSNETDKTIYSGCREDSRIELWTLNRSGHFPNFAGSNIMEKVLKTIRKAPADTY